MVLTKKKAKELAILKWKYIIENEGHNNIFQLRLKYPELIGLRHNCGYCEKYLYTTSKTLTFCAKCPIRPKMKNYDDIDNVGCAQKIHPFNQWRENDYNAKENAQAVLDLIEKS